MRCGVCSGNFPIIMGDRWGCANRRETGACDNHTTITNSLAEQRVWLAIDAHLLHPVLIAA
jgi:hypothetical protein